MTTLDTLRIAADALAERRYDEAYALFCDLGPDFAWLRRRDRKSTPRPTYLPGDGVSWDRNVIAQEGRRAIVREQRTRDWFAWSDRSKIYDEAQNLGLANISAILKQAYPADAIEARVRSWGNVMLGLGRPPQGFYVAQRVTPGPLMSATNRRYLARALLS